jgi:hypothetical protein
VNKGKLELSRRDYLALLTVMQMADWVLHAHKVDEREETAAFRELEQKVFALADSFDCGHLVEYDDEEERYYPTAEFDESSPGMEFIEDFENESFWNELLERLVERDLVRQLGEKAVRRLDEEARCTKEEPYRRLYGEEFARHGVDRLEILDQLYLSDAKGKRQLS